LQAQPELGLPLAQLATFVTAYFAGYVASNCISGVMTDRSAHVYAWAQPSLALAFLRWASDLRILTGGSALQCGMGFATGADYAACIKIVAGWFEREERGRALGIWFTATSLGVVTANSLALPLASVLNWRGAYIGLGAVTISVGLLSLAFFATDRVYGAETEPLRIRALLRNRNLVLVSMAGFCALWGTWGFVFSLMR